MVFAKIDFTHVLAGHSLYQQYNFDDPWIFRVQVTPDKKSDAAIGIASKQLAQCPDWAWVATVAPGKYSKLSSSSF